MSERLLEGKRIALTGPRKAEELGRLVEKQGGIPLARPAQGTVILQDEQVRTEMIRLLDEDYDWFIFTTGIGIETLLETARKLDKEALFLEKLKGAKIAARGYKAVGTLKKLGLTPEARDDDGTTAGLVRVLSPFSFRNARVALQLHGDPAPRLVNFLQEQGASYHEILPYVHTPPEPEVLEQLLADIIRGHADAVMFTSGPQVRFLFKHAGATGRTEELCKAFEQKTVAASVGKFTAECLREEGVSRIVVPKEERMGNLVIALGEYFADGRNVYEGQQE
ncbi:uroporphyrinogen-III synthase [Paenibacillus sp. P26]|nr:uroporphyrinogen-III synthase [Paenibacillus sp. P26]UUZ96184.1 uroporphyrinogen-III synthase [Paenibacillus sp. P25]